MASRIADLGRRFMRLERADRRLVVEAVVLVAIARVGLRALPFVSLRKLFDAAKRLRSRSGGRTARIAWAIDAAAQVMPARNCLQDALAADVMLCRRGYPSTLRLGVKKSDNARMPIDAHAWVESDGAIVAGRLATLPHYKPFS